MDNSKACPELDSGTQKEGVSRIYNGQDGYAPMAAYLGREGWCLELELRAGKQHSPSEFIPFLNRVLEKARSLTSRKLLVRPDSAHDAPVSSTGQALETRLAPGSGPGQALAGQNKIRYILKWNPRKEDLKEWARRIFEQGKVTTPRPGKRVGLLTVRIQQIHAGKTYRFKRVMRAVERTIDRHGQILLMPQIEVDGWWTTLDLPENQVIRLYEDHGTSEPFHSEIKSDMDAERLPSGKFATNALILTLTGLSYNILRAMGQLALVDGKSPVRHPAKRRRIKTVMQELIYLAARLVKTGRRFKLLFSRHCPGFGAFQALYQRWAFG